MFLISYANLLFSELFSTSELRFNFRRLQYPRELSRFGVVTLEFRTSEVQEICSNDGLFAVDGRIAFSKALSDRVAILKLGERRLKTA